MNISPISVTPNQSVMPDGQSTNTVTTENGSADFNQILQALSPNVTTNSATAMPITTNKGITWPMAWLEILGQNPNPSGPALDLVEEAPNLANQSGESAISLTEIMTALQPMVTSSQLAVTTPLADDQSNNDAKKPSSAMDEANLALLTLMSGFSPLQPVTSSSEMSLPSVATTAIANQVTQSTPNWILSLNGGLPGNEQTTLAKPEVIADLKSTKAVVAPIETTTVAESAKMNSTFAQALSEQLTTTPVSFGINHPAETTPNNIVEPTLKPKVQPAEATPSPVISTDTLNIQNSTFKGQPVIVETKAQLPETPALHQIIDHISLMTQHGQTEVQLHLHPESLGQLSIQLHIIDGDIGVRMVAETAQAQKLIQDHLPQLKAAFTAQGLQLNDMAVAVGSGASSFDMSGHRPNNNWFQQPAHSSAYPTLTDKPEPATVRSVLPTRSNGYAVDYQV